MGQDFVKISRWLYQSDSYRIHSISTAGRWKVERRVEPVETIGFAGTLEEAVKLANEDAHWVSATQPLTPRHEHGIIVAEDNERTTPVTDSPKFNTCQCFSIPTAEEAPDGGTMTVYRSCGETIPKRRTFKPGHDAKLKSVLLKAFRAGEEFRYLDGGMMVSVDPKHEAEKRGWGHFMTPAKPKVVKATEVPEPVEHWATPEDKANHEAAKTREADLSELAGFRPARVKVGAVWRDGHIVTETDALVTVRVHNAKSKAKDYTLARDSAKLEIG